jgi:hypothetical protein
MTKAGGSRLGMLYAFIRVLLIMLFGFTPHSIKIKFGKPIKFDEYKKADLDAFREIAEKLQGEVQSLLSSIRCPS